MPYQTSSQVQPHMVNLSPRVEALLVAWQDNETESFLRLSRGGAECHVVHEEKCRVAGSNLLQPNIGEFRLPCTREKCIDEPSQFPLPMKTFHACGTSNSSLSDPRMVCFAGFEHSATYYATVSELAFYGLTSGRMSSHGRGLRPPP